MKRCSAVAIGAAILMAMTACGGSAGGGSGSGTGPTGDPVSGGHATVMQISEPRGLDPGLVGNSWSSSALLGNAIFGTLLIDDPETGELEYKLAESLTTEDGGATFTLKLREGLVYSDGSPLTAEDVKFNWERLKDPAVGGASTQDAMMVAESKVVDDTTLEFTMAEPVANFPMVIVSSPMNWVAKPEPIKRGTVDENPIGAGPFVLEEWARQNVIELVRNDKYFDAPKPYLDKISIRTSSDTNQRYNTLASGGVDLTSETSWATVAKAEREGRQSQTVALSGGNYLVMNTARAPFDDLRARRAVAAALDLELIDSAAYHGEGKIPTTLFDESSPFYSDLPLIERDIEAAQELFDEMAADGDPVSFTVKTFPTVENKAIAESVQAQLSALDNVEVEVQTIDFAETSSIYGSKDYDMIVTACSFVDPEPKLYNCFHSGSRSNSSSIADDELDAALEAARVSDSVEDRKAAYDTVQERLQEVVPGIFYTRSAPSVLANNNVGGVRLYGLGSPLPEELWLAE